MRLSIAAALAALCLASPAARAQYQRPFSHDGLFLRLEAGVGYMHTQADFADTTASAYGGNGYLGFAIGGAIAPDLVLYGELWGMAAPSPTFQLGSATTNPNNNNITLNYGGLGIGIGTFIMPANVFLGLSVDATRLGISNHSNGDQSNSDIGGAVTLTLGKQFWLTDFVGLGVSIKGIAGGNRDNNDSSNSATYKTFTGLGTVTLTFG